MQQDISFLRDLVGPEFFNENIAATPAPRLSEADRIKRSALLQRIVTLEWEPVKTFLDGMLQAYQAGLESVQSDASTNATRGSIAMIRFFLDLPSMAQRELSHLASSEEDKKDTST